MTAFRKNLEQIPPPNYQEENEIWIDPAGGVHHGYEGDPAAMYI